MMPARLRDVSLFSEMSRGHARLSNVDDYRHYTHIGLGTIARRHGRPKMLDAALATRLD